MWETNIIQDINITIKIHFNYFLVSFDINFTHVPFHKKKGYVKKQEERVGKTNRMMLDARKRGKKVSIIILANITTPC